MPVKDLKRNDFLGNLSYESNERTNGHNTVCK